MSPDALTLDPSDLHLSHDFGIKLGWSCNLIALNHDSLEKRGNLCRRSQVPIGNILSWSRSRISKWFRICFTTSEFSWMIMHLNCFKSCFFCICRKNNNQYLVDNQALYFHSFMKLNRFLSEKLYISYQVT